MTCVNRFTRWKGICPRQKAIKLGTNQKKIIIKKKHNQQHNHTECFTRAIGLISAKSSVDYAYEFLEVFFQSWFKRFDGFSMLRESWFTFTITGLSVSFFLEGARDAFGPVETLLSSTVADTTTVTQDSNRINHLIRDECILKGNLFTNYLPCCQIPEPAALYELPSCKCSLLTIDGALTKHDAFSCQLLKANHASPHIFFFLFIPRSMVQ